MDKELTTTKQETFDSRIVCAEARGDSKIAPPFPERVGASDLQGAQSGSAELESARQTTVVAPRPGGASSSKRARKTRPWNASLPTTVVTSSKALERRFVSVDEFDPTDAEYLANHPPYSLPVWRPHGIRGEGALMRSLARGRSPVNHAGGERREIQGRSLRPSCPKG